MFVLRRQQEYRPQVNIVLSESCGCGRPRKAEKIRDEMESSQPVHCQLAACPFESDEYDFNLAGPM